MLDRIQKMGSFTVLFAVVYCILITGLSPEVNDSSNELERQLRNVSAFSSCNPESVLGRTRTWLAADRGEIRDGLQLVFPQHTPSGPKPIRIDGLFDDAFSYNKVSDPRGDGDEEVDLLESGVALDASRNIHFFFRTHKRPGAGIYYVLHIDLIGDRHNDVMFYVSFSPDGEASVHATWLDTKESISLTGLMIQSRDILEGVIPLSALQRSGTQVKEQIFVIHSVRAIRSQHTDVSAGSVSLPVWSPTALLLCHLFAYDRYLPGDSMSLAIASRMATLYSAGTADVQPLVLRDAIGWFDEYMRLLDFQVSTKLPFSSKELNFVEKLILADAFLSATDGYLSGGLDRQAYEFYVISPDQMEVLRREIAPMVGRSVLDTVERLEDWAWKKQRYHWPEPDRAKLSPDEQALFRKNAYFVLFKDKQFNYWQLPSTSVSYAWYRKHGFYSGSCGHQAGMMRLALKAIGLPSVINFYHTFTKRSGKKEHLDGASHTFSVYFDPQFRKWKTIQAPGIAGGLPTIQDSFKIAGFDYTIFRFQLFPEGSFPAFQEHDLTLSEMSAGLLAGFNRDSFEALLLSDQTRGSFVRRSSLPRDSDLDGLFDDDEVSFGTRVDEADTDGDGVSDLFEILNGTDPIRPEQQSLPVIDGFTLDPESIGLVTLKDPQHDSVVRENVYDIQQLGARVFSNQLYISVSYYGLQPKSLARQHEFWINTGKQLIWFGCYEHESNCNMMVQSDGRWSNSQKATGTHFRRERDVEFLAPLALLGNAARLDISYTIMSGPKGHEIRISDAVRGLNLQLPSQLTGIQSRSIPGNEQSRGDGLRILRTGSLPEPRAP